jgi:hypothetical protein
MSDQRYDILFRGELLPGFSADTVRDNLARLFKASPETIARLMDGGTHALKKNADHATVVKYREAMQRAGAKAELRAAADTPSMPAPAPAPAPAAAIESSELGLAPPGTELLAAHERTHAPDPGIDTSHLKLLPAFTQSPVSEQRSAPAAPDTSHLSVAKAGEDLLTERAATKTPPPPDISHLSLAAPGANLEVLHPVDATLIPDISGITLAPPGAPLDEIRPQRKPVNPDISRLRLEP